MSAKQPRKTVWPLKHPTDFTSRRVTLERAMGWEDDHPAAEIRIKLAELRWLLWAFFSAGGVHQAKIGAQLAELLTAAPEKSLSRLGRPVQRALELDPELSKSHVLS